MIMESSTHAFFLWTLSRAEETAKAYQVLLAGDHFMEGNFQGERAHMYSMHLLGPHIYPSRHLMHQIFIPPFPLSIGGLTQSDLAFLSLFPATLAQHTDTWISWVGLCFLDRFSALSHAGTMGPHMGTHQNVIDDGS